MPREYREEPWVWYQDLGTQQDYEGKLKVIGLTTLQERRHRADMQMVHKLMKGENRLDPRIWFERAADSGRATRITADPMNIKQIQAVWR